MLFDPVSQEAVYALKGNVKAPAGTVAATAVALAQNRINDALNKPLALSGETQPTVTINANSYPIADTATPVS